jgi:hypothetical protein
MCVEDGIFSEASYNMCSIEALEAALARGADETDMKNWEICEQEWREQIAIAIDALKADASGE